MLQGTKSVSMNYNSLIDGKPVVYMATQIQESGSASTSIVVQDQELYEANKEECRKDIEEFNKLVYAIEDGGAANAVEE
jgi:hypothetical protein